MRVKPEIVEIVWNQLIHDEPEASTAYLLEKTAKICECDLDTVCEILFAYREPQD